MSGYGYDFSPTPRRSGLRSALTGFLTIVAVVAVSTISGAVVTLELLAPSSQSNTRVASDAPKIVASVPQQTTQPQTIQSQNSSQQTTRALAPQTAQAIAPNVAPRAAASTDTVASIQTQQAPSRAQAPAQPSPQAAATITANTAPASTVAAAPARAEARAEVADSELTFSKGYARRRAAATKAVAGNSQLANVGVAAGEFGRTAVKVAKAKPRTQTVATQDRQDPRRPDAYYSANRYAFGDRQPQQQQHRQNGPFGFFDRLF